MFSSYTHTSHSREPAPECSTNVALPSLVQLTPPTCRTRRGAASSHLRGRRSCHRPGGSMTWSSTEMIRGRSITPLLRCEGLADRRSRQDVLALDVSANEDV